MKQLLSLFLIIFSLGLCAQQDTSSYVVVSDIVVNGNDVTKDDIMKAAQDVTLDTVFMLEGTAKESDSNE